MTKFQPGIGGIKLLCVIIFPVLLTNQVFLILNPMYSLRCVVCDAFVDRVNYYLLFSSHRFGVMNVHLKINTSLTTVVAAVWSWLRGRSGSRKSNGASTTTIARRSAGRPGRPGESETPI